MQVWLVATVSLLALLMLVMGVQAVWGLVKRGSVAVPPNVVDLDSVAATEPLPVVEVPSQPAAVAPVARRMVGSTAA